MEMKFGPDTVDEPNLLYKLQRKIKVFHTNNPLPNRGYNLVASSSKYGIVFIASPDGTLCAYFLKELVDNECEPKHLTIKLQEKPTHIAVSCDHELLAVTGGQLLCVYKVADFQNNNVSPSLTIRSDVNPTAFVSALQWNPCIPDNIAIAFYDGTLLMAQVATSQLKKVPSKARCICWSPKGKQLVTGNSDGTLSQYKPDLTPAKTIPAPNLFEGSPVEALAVYWISTFQFAVVYKNAANSSRPAVTIINTPKAGQLSCINYEDICYSMGSNRPWYYYLQGLAQWNMILSSSSNSMEMATLASVDGANWVQWCQPDEARPELPLTDKKQENYPVGVCIDTCAIHQLPWGENSTLPHMPLLHVVSQSGLLTIFNVINLNNTAVQVCSPPQQMALPAAAMTSVIPGDAPAQAAPAATPAPIAQPKQQIAQTTQMAPIIQAQSTPAVSQFGALTANAPKPTSFAQLPNTQTTTQGFVAASIQSEQKPVQIKSVPLPQLQATVAPPQAATTHQVAPKPQPPPQQAQENAALKAEQERINEIKTNQELKNILVKEVNDFQMELYKFMVKTRETQTKLLRDIDSINANFNFNSLDSEQLKKECYLDDLRGAIVQLKLELVRACAVVAEARTHAEAKDYNQWTQADPLTTKRVASVKKLAYYVNTQLEQAQRALDYKWSEAVSRDPKYNKPGQRMIRPILDDVYQPLVKQQEILSRQQAVLRTLRDTLGDCDIAPMFKSTSLLRSTPFRNKDPLSKLTKNILNMSIDSTTKTQQPLLTASKLDALRDMLSNHKTVKIKPVNVELRQHLVTMKQNYEKSMKEKAQPVVTQAVKMEYEMKHKTAHPITVPKVEVKVETKSEFQKNPSFTNISMNINVPSYSPVGTLKPVPGLPNVARTLFTDEPKPEPPKPTIQPDQVHKIVISQPQKLQPQQVKPQLIQPQPVQPQKVYVQQVQPQPSKPLSAFSYPTTTAPASANTRSVLKDLLQNKLDAKNDANTFMGQPICSPSSFAFSTPSSTTTTTAAPSAVFTSKPISEISNMFNKFQPHPIAPEPKLQPPVQDIKPQAFALPNPSSETGEPEATETKTITLKPKTEKPVTNLFAMKTPTPPNNSSNVPDVLKLTHDVKADNTKPVEKEKLKENVPKNDENATQIPAPDKKETAKPLAAQMTNKASVLDATQPSISISLTATLPSTPKQADIKIEAKVENPKVAEQSQTPSEPASSIFAAANAASPTAPKPQIPDGPTTRTLQDTSKQDTPVSTSSETSDSTSSISSLDSGNVMSSMPSLLAITTTPSAASIFGAAVASQPKTTSQAGSIFATAAASSPPAYGATQGSIFGTESATQSSVFGTSTTQSVFTSVTAKPSVFSTPTPASPTSVFGAPSSQAGSIFGSTATQASVFATTTEPPSSTSSVFGSSSTTSVFGAAPTIPSSVFGTATASTASVFGSTTSPSQASIFGSAATSTPSAFISTTTEASVFSGTTTTTQSIFGSTTSSKPSVFSGSGTSVFGAANNQPSVFGAPSTQASVFGSAPTTQASVFGSAPTTQASVFGSAPTTQASVFGSAPTTPASVFGSAPVTQASVFGTTPTTTAQSGSIFGGAEMSLFDSANISTTSAPSPTSGGSIFGGGSTGSVFGSGNTNVFGGKSSFGQPNPTAAAIFGGGGASSFGQKPATGFWGGGNSTGEGGFGSTGFGQQATTQASSIFGGGSGGSFSTPSPAGQAFGTPQQGGAFGGGDTTSVFGSPQQQASGAFGGSPAFGQPSGFGSPPSGGGFGGGFGGFNKSPGGSFGASATFGGGPTFGGTGFGGSSPSKMFGGPTPTGFGPTQSNATFENLATQNTLTFGNLAQQSGQQPPAAPTFNTSPSFSGWRG